MRKDLVATVLCWDFGRKKGVRRGVGSGKEEDGVGFADVKVGAGGGFCVCCRDCETDMKMVGAKVVIEEAGCVRVGLQAGRHTCMQVG